MNRYATASSDDLRANGKFGIAMRTSISSPLRIDVLDIQSCHARLGLTICPGKQGDSQYGVPWHRDLEADLNSIRLWGASSLVTVMEDAEMHSLHVGNLSQAATQASLNWFHLPITDGDIPDQRFHAAWKEQGPRILSELLSNKDVVVYCRGGLGRTGMVACFLLVELGYEPGRALDSVRAARPGAVETASQEAYVLGYRRAFY